MSNKTRAASVRRILLSAAMMLTLGALPASASGGGGSATGADIGLSGSASTGGPQAGSPMSSIATWELHTNGLAGPSASGTMILAGYNHVAVSYDPTAGKVAASIEGVPVASLDYIVSGVQYAGFQGNGIVNDFLVQAGAIAVP